MSEFIKNRTPFIVLHGDVLIKKVADDRTCLEWVMDMGYSKDQWERAIRGYIMEGRIQFFTGKDYRCAPVVNGDIVKAVRTYHSSVYGYLPQDIFNGVHEGKPGEVWQPICELRTS